MASVFESFGWKNTSTSRTAINQLGINDRLPKLQSNSQKYFIVEENAQAADGNLLAVKIQPHQSFNLKNTDHRDQLRAAIELFKENSNTLKSIDHRIAYSTVLGIVATSLSFIPLVGYFGLLGWGSAVYHLMKRGTAMEKYRESLNLLVATCNWSLGQGPEAREASKEELTCDADIREMMKTLYPVITEQQARHLIADDIEDAFVQELLDYEGKYKLNKSAAFNPKGFFNGDESIAKSKRSAEFSRCIYGYNKGNTTDFLDAFLSIFPDIYHAIHHGFKRLQHWWSKDSKSLPAVNTALTNTQP
jgi:hypothetical protein